MNENRCSVRNRTSELTDLDDLKWHEQIATWNDTAVRYPVDATIHGLIECKARECPERIALKFESQVLSYGELNARANRLARFLRTAGARPDVPIGVCAERSLEMVVALLAILKAGAAYVPLDPEHPIERLRSMIADAAPPVILTQAHLASRIDSLGVPIWCLDRDWAEVAELEGHDLESLASPTDLAYIIFTSGSTGTPKGAMNEHAGVCNRLLWMQDEYPLTADDRVLQKTPFSFDVSVWEFFLPLLAGARLILARPGGHREPAYLAGLIRDEKITVVHFVPSMLQAFLEEPGLEQSCASICHVFTSGEALAEHVATRCLRRIPAKLHNLYGPTEAAIDVTYWECRRDAPPGPIPIGRPIANMRTHVLDSELRPVPIGEPGELFLAGVGVGRGYLGRPDLTAERFLHDFEGDEHPGRMYRTGDLVRWRHDGVLEFLGRLDHQVKIRGFRIELEEIEAALAGFPGVRQSAAVAHEVQPGDTRLVGYVVASTADTRAIQSHLAGLLPDYMIPSVILRLDAFPLTSSGKLDRGQLPAPTLERDGSIPFAAPRNPLEDSLARIWRDMLGVERIGIHDDFFRLGGNSLVAARIAARVASLVGVIIPLRTLFENPTIAGLAQAQLAPAAIDDTPDPIAPVADAVDVPASFGQRRLWFIDQLERKNLSAYNIATATRLDGYLDHRSLRQALEDIVARHEPLRTTYAIRDGQLVQVVQPLRPLDLPVLEVGHLDAQTRDASVNRLMRDEADRPFDLEADLMLRGALLRLSENAHVFVLTIHHIAADGWSLDVLFSELAAAYAARATGGAAALPVLPVRYADYAVWQERRMAGDRLEKGLRYWREQLRGLEPLELPADRPRPPVPSHHGRSILFELSPSLVASLRRLCDDSGTTPHMALLAAFQLTLARLTGRSDLAVGVPYAGRSRPELEGLIGFFVNTVVIRTNFAGSPTFRELLNRVRETCLAASDHQEIPFDRLVQEMNPERSHNRNPLAQVAFQLVELAALDLSTVGIKATPLPDPLPRVRFDLELLIEPRGDELQGTVRYAADLFDDATIERLAGHYRKWLESAVDAPDQPLDDMPLVSERERQTIVHDWNDTAVSYPDGATIHELFRARAALSPTATALIFGREWTSYADLDRRSDRVASRLRALGARPESIVAFSLARSTEQIVTILGILKAGACYLPLDRANPDARNLVLIRDTQAIVVVTDRSQSARFAALDVPTVCVDDLDRDGDRADETVGDDPDLSSRSLAYVTYTSGSTGEPKGVMVEHRSVVRLVFGQRYAKFAPDRVFLQLAPIAFDASTFEIWGPLLSGATLVIAPDGPLEFHSLGELISAHGVTTLFLTTGLFNSVIEECPGALAGVREILTGGEAMSERHLRMAQEKLGPATRISNIYGPTECTTFACHHPLSSETPAGAGPIPIGRPIANTSAYVLDGHRRPVPIGVPGELYLGGDGVARGYWNRPELTAERFVADPFAVEAGARLYRTGDAARWRADGTLEFLGRLDTQVKIRGFRIEPGEIEAALAAIPGIGRSVVVAHFCPPFGHRVVAYLVADPASGRATDADVSAALSRMLPDYMIPSAFYWLDELPLTANGKIDRSALPAPDLERRAPKATVAPRTPHEESMAAIWQELLGLERVGVHDDFFRLGGHSMLALRLLARVKDAFGVAVPVDTLLRARTVGELTEAVLTRHVHEAPTIFQLESGNRALPFFCFPGAYGQEGRLLGHGLALAALSREIGPGYLFYAVTIGAIPADVDSTALIDFAASRALAEIRAIHPHGPYLLGGFSFGGLVALEVARTLLADGEDVPLLALLDAYGPGFPRPRSRAEQVRALTAEFSNLSPRGRASYLATKLRRRIKRFSGLDPAVQLERDPVAAKIRVASQAYLGRLLRYPGRIHLFRASTVPKSLKLAFDEPTYGWGPIADGGVETCEVPGTHLTLFEPENLPELARAIRSRIDATCQEYRARPTDLPSV